MTRIEYNLSDARITYGYYISNEFHVAMNDLERTIEFPPRRRIRQSMRVLNIYNDLVSENDQVMFIVKDSLGNVYPLEYSINKHGIRLCIYPVLPEPKKLGSIIVQFRIVKGEI